MIFVAMAAFSTGQVCGMAMGAAVANASSIPDILLCGRTLQFSGARGLKGRQCFRYGQEEHWCGMVSRVITITLGEQVENYMGMQKLGPRPTRAISVRLQSMVVIRKIVDLVVEEIGERKMFLPSVPQQVRRGPQALGCHGPAF